MTAKPYVPVTWGDEPVFTDKLNQMGNNEQYLFENSPRMYYNSYGIKKTSGVKVMCGILVLPTSKTRIKTGIFNFGTFFSAGSYPTVTTGVAPRGGSTGGTLTLRSVDAGSIDYRGFRATLYSNVAPDPYATYIHFIAMGW